MTEDVVEELWSTESRSDNVLHCCQLQGT